MKILGYTKVVLLPLMILATTMGSSIASQIPPRDRNTLGESTSCRRENQKEEREGSQVSPTGRSITEASDELKRDIKENGRDTFNREILSLHTTLGKVNYEETKQLFLHNVLMEALDDGTPMYYNSNILGRYMRKDYGQFYEKSKNYI